MDDIAVPAPASGKELAEGVYDLLMADIEPELLLANIPLLKAKYATETPDEHAIRMERYKTAYKDFDLAMATFMNDVDGEVRTTQRKVLKNKEIADRKNEEDVLTSLTSAFD
jgi:hypothetical protein